MYHHTVQILLQELLYRLQHKMAWKVTYVFKAEDKLQDKFYTEEPTPQKLTEWIQAQKNEIEIINTLSNIKPLLKIQNENPAKPSKYLKLSKSRDEIQQYLSKNSKNIIVQFFHSKKQEEVRSIIRKVVTKLDNREKELKDLNDELKQQFNPNRVSEIISQKLNRNTSEVQKMIEVALVVCDPLVDETGEQPIFQDEVDISNHIERLKRASISNSSLTIKAKRYWGTKQQLQNLKDKKTTNSQHILIAQIFTRVASINNTLMISLEKHTGKRQWQPFEDLFVQSKIDLLIIVGVGASLLKQANYPRSLILISTCSIEQRRPIFTKVNQFQNEYSYNDIYSQTFLEQFYQNIFKRMEIQKSIRQSFEQAKTHLTQYSWCCCLHQHMPACKWHKIVSKIGELEAHRLFKHRYNQWNKNNYFPMTASLQQFLLGNNKVCAAEGPCCRLDKRVPLHMQSLSNLLIWNIKNDFPLQSSNSLLGINRFQSESYDKPTGRKRPLTIYKLIQQLLKNHIIIIKSPLLSLAKRYISFAKQYLQVRQLNTYFHQIQKYDENEFKKAVEQLIRNTPNPQHTQFYIQIPHNQQKSDKFYEKILEQHSKLTQDLNKKFKFPITLKYIFLTCDPNFNDKYASFRVDDPLPPERYHYILSKYSYEHIQTHFKQVTNQIINGDHYNQQTINQICENIRNHNENAYIFIGFLAQFSEDGFYLTKSGRVILEQLFDQNTIIDAVNNKLPVEHISLSDSIFLQLHKSYHQHFKSKQNFYLIHFNKKRLQYYYILLRVYCQLLPESKQRNSNHALRYLYHKQGLFSIDIQADQDNVYDQIVAICKQLVLQYGDLNQILYLHNNFRHAYHLHQIQRILEQGMKKRRSKLTGSKSALRQTQPSVFTYLLWNIVLKAWVLCKTIQDNIQQNVSHFQKVLLVFLIKVEANTAFSEVARVQLYVLIGQQAPKPKQEVNFGFLNEILSYLRNYACKQRVLSTLQFSWGNTIKFKELLTNCFELAKKIRDILTPKINSTYQEDSVSFVESISHYRMYNNFNCTEWDRELLKLSQRKVLYYFHFTKMLKSIHVLASRDKREKEFLKRFQLKDIADQFRQLRNKLGQHQKDEKHRVLVDLYLSLLVNHSEVNSTTLNTIKGKIQPEFMPIFNYLCRNIEQKALFNKNGLIICARARTILQDGTPCLFTRKRNFTMLYLKKLIEGKQLKISYFTLTPDTLNNLSVQQSNQKCQMLYLILRVDAPSPEYLLFGSEQGVQAQKIPIRTFAHQLKNCKIKILILCGQNSIAVCKDLQNIYRQWPTIVAPIMVAVCSDTYCLKDAPFNQYRSPKWPTGKRVWQYLSNEVSQIAMDLLIIAIVANINRSIHQRHFTFNQKILTEKIQNSHRLVKRVLSSRFTSANQVLDQIHFLAIFPESNPNITINRISQGNYQDLTTQFYSSQNNLLDEKYYENVGRGLQVHKIIMAITKQGQRLVQVTGNKGTGKSTILQQVCWISQVKSLFKFGIWKFDLQNEVNSGQMKQFFESREFKTISRKNFETEVLIVLDNVNQIFLTNYEYYRSLLSKLIGKDITLIYSTNSAEIGNTLQQIVQIKNPLMVNTNLIDQNLIYGLLVSYIKQNPQTIYTQQFAASFEQKVYKIMQKVKQMEEGNRLNQALTLLKGSESLKQTDINDNFYNFYNQHFETLKKYLHNYREIQIHFC